MPVPALTDEQIHDLTKPLGLEITAATSDKLAARVEVATRGLVLAFREWPAGEEKRHNREYQAELGRIANDPARALDQPPETVGGREAFDFMLRMAEFGRVDLASRAGAVTMGDQAARLLAEMKPKPRADEKKKPRSDQSFRLGVACIFEDIARALDEVYPQALESWPSKEGDQSCPATIFAMAFIQIVADRAHERLSDPSPRQQRWLDILRNKNHGTLLAGLRDGRSGVRISRDWFEGDRAAIFVH